MSATHSLDLEASSSQYASIADASCPNLEIAGSQTWEAWIKPETNTGFQYIMGKVDALATIYKTLVYYTNKIYFELNGLNVGTGVSNTLIDPNVFTHVAGVYDQSSQKLRLYINGELDKEVSVTGTVSATGASFAVGRGGDYNGNYFDGLIRNARVWNVARTQAQIRIDMNVDTPSDISGLQGNWVLNNSYTDSSSNTYNLTASGSPIFITQYPDAIDLTENNTWNKKHKISIDSAKVSGSSNLTNIPILLTEDNFLSEIWTYSQGQEINRNSLINHSALTAYYQLESGALTTDSSGNGHTLTNNNTVGEGSGKFAGGADYGTGNTNKYLNISTDLNIDGNAAITIMGWIKLNAEPGTGASYALASHCSNTGAQKRLDIDYQDSAGVKRIVVDSGDSYIYHNMVLGTSSWTHLAVTRDASGNTELYVNGKLIGTGTTGSGTLNDNFFSIGSRNSLGFFSNAIIDDVAVFNQVLTNKEIAAIIGGSDIRFSVDSSGEDRLAHEIVTWDDINQTTEIWVKINSLYYSVNTDFYVHYDNASPAPLVENEAFGAHQVWDANHKGVWHLQEISGSRIDSTSNSNDLTDNNTTSSGVGKLGVAADFESTNSEYLSKTDNTSLSVTGDITISGWFKWESLTGGEMAMVGKYESSPSSSYLLLWNDTGDNLQFYASNNGTSVVNVNASFTPTLSTWYHIAMIYDASAGEARIYVNGVDIGGGTGLPTSIYDSASGFKIGAYNATAQSFFDGLMDEIKIVAEEKNPDWITTEYNNQNSPATFAIPNSSFIPKMVIFV